MKFDKSLELYERAKRSLAGGVNTNSRISELPWPLYFERGKGALLYDADGNELIDYVLGRGPMIFGHSPDFLLDAVAEAMTTGQIFGGQHPLEFQVAELVQEMVPCAELVRFMSSGTEAVQLALRVARAYTGRAKIVRFDTQFHGWGESIFYGMSEYEGDELPTAIPQAKGFASGTAGDIVPLPINDLDMLTRALDVHHDEVAAILSSPMPHHTVIDPGYFEEPSGASATSGASCSSSTRSSPAFRVAAGGGQELLGVTPDIATFAKAMANGFPVAMVAGNDEMMGLMEDGTVMHGGTVNTNVMCMAAADVCLRRLAEEDGAVYDRLRSTGHALMDGLREKASKHEISLDVAGPGPYVDVTFTDEPELPGLRRTQGRRAARDLRPLLPWDARTGRPPHEGRHRGRLMVPVDRPHRRGDREDAGRRGRHVRVDEMTEGDDYEAGQEPGDVRAVEAVARRGAEQLGAEQGARSPLLRERQGVEAGRRRRQRVHRLHPRPGTRHLRARARLPARGGDRRDAPGADVRRDSTRRRSGYRS